jgi:H+/Cl- antiporter ClcA
VSNTAGVLGGLVGVLFSAATGGFECRGCGPIDKSEHSPQTRQKMLMGSILMIAIAIAVIVLLVLFLPRLRHQYP